MHTNSSWLLVACALVHAATAAPIKEAPTIGKVQLASGENGAVAADAQICSEVGVGILKSQGNAVDAAIATALCIGTVNSFSSGIGGGGFMTIRTSNGTVDFINFRETAPAGSAEEMFKGKPEASKQGGLAIATPGEIRGFELAHKKHGRIAWKELFEPSIRLSRNGFPVTEQLAIKLQAYSELILNNTSFREIYAPRGKVLKAGEVVRRLRYANTLEAIATRGPDEFYKGGLANTIVNAIQKAGGIITLEDLAAYSAVSTPPLVGYYHGHKVISAPPPASGAVVISALNTLEGYNLALDKLNYLNLHRVIESFKYGYAQRTYLGDPAFVNTTAKIAEMLSKDQGALRRRNISSYKTFPVEYYQPSYQQKNTPGTTHLSAMDKEGGAVALTSTINLEFGAKVLDADTGIIFNNEMDDFSTPGLVNAFGYLPSPANFIKPGKRPLSSMSPTIVETDGYPSLAVGASGGSYITTATVQMILNIYDFGKSVDQAVAAPRVHHQLMPDVVTVEPQYDERYVKALESRGHNVTRLATTQCVVQAVTKLPSGYYNAASDSRKRGVAAAY
ncbi:gamma-glutamyltranspeptidase [Basidiobolus meristosporus CBS 931.73]|uniref:Glutathione hydrolase n=1 Tax=Basidiobolus meristosporus CBS 931.73 TaxID=1314790 RepID=A0A1Y1YMT2_9FUNG|nr:gamma-glutamyltranspeptidase [Basidiobolus meristosporus CBS 931.73]|eukprot:ORX99340.1 gamma-glutamyltranspeptidase [Basidiobolus meristosporus CBS 931.73]